MRVGLVGQAARMEPLTPTAQKVLEARYRVRDASGRLAEDWEGLCRRVSGSIAAAEKSFGGDARGRDRRRRVPPCAALCHIRNAT